MTEPRVLVACVGNIFLGDDAFGVEVARRLAQRRLPDGVSVVDFGIRGFDLAHALADPFDGIVLVDAIPRGGSPGTLYVLEPDASELEAPAGEVAIETHAMDPLRVLRLAWATGARPKRVRIVGCEPTPLTEDEFDAGIMGLSEPVHAAVDEAVGLVESLAAQLCGKAVVES
jgi:hydrogenase maturation protease